MDFLDLAAARFSLMDLPSGSVVATGRKDAIVEILREQETEDRPSLERLLVIALDDDGRRLRSCRADELIPALA